MPDEQLVANHYTHGGLLNAIRDGIAKMGKTIASVNIDDLAPVDEFHIGGRVATQSFLDQLDIGPSHHVLDVGCGLGGGSRFAARTYGCRMTGVDLTREYVETGNALCSWVGLSDKISLQIGNATALPHPNEAFDRAYMLHVGMNIADKELLISELHRVVRPGAKIGIYDVMRVNDGDLTFPVPWAAGPESDSVASVPTYKAALERSGFNIIAERNRRDFALEFFAQLQAKVAGANGPPPLGLHILMGSTAPIKVKNMIENISRNVIAPVEIVAEKKA
ncbi:MAG: methyltransferase domain-containing protein [Betaproteobacteria bacterium]|nr:methyltransferase domain-containing protein [Betaproteobacteria bacterium]